MLIGTLRDGLPAVRDELDPVAPGVPCHAWLEVRATRSLLGYSVYGAIWGHFYTT